MEKIRRILVVSRMNPYSRKVILFGVSLARKYEAKLVVLHLVFNPVETTAMNMPGMFPGGEYGNYQIIQQAAKKQLDKVIKQEIRVDFPIKEVIGEGDSVEEITEIVAREKIDLIVMSAHEEGRFEHALFGGENDAIIRKMPCSILLMKDELQKMKT